MSKLHAKFFTNCMFFTLLLLIFILIFLVTFRKVDGKNWEHIAWTLGYSTEGGLYATLDDGNPVWEECDLPDDQREAMLRKDDYLNYGGEDKVEALLADDVEKLQVKPETDSITSGWTVLQQQAQVS